MTNDHIKEYEQWKKERESDPVHGVQVAKILFEMDVVNTVMLINRGQIKHSLDELREMTACQQLQAGAVGMHDRADESDPDECCTYAVYTTDADGFHRIVEDYPSAEKAFNKAEQLAAHHGVAIDDQSQTDHHVILLDDDTLLDRAFNLSQAEKSLAYYAGNGEDAYLASSKDFPLLRVQGWRAKP